MRQTIEDTKVAMKTLLRGYIEKQRPESWAKLFEDASAKAYHHAVNKLETRKAKRQAA